MSTAATFVELVELLEESIEKNLYYEISTDSAKVLLAGIKNGIATPILMAFQSDDADFAHILANHGFALRLMNLPEWLDRARHKILDLESKLRLATTATTLELSPPVATNRTLFSLNEHQLKFLNLLIEEFEDVDVAAAYNDEALKLYKHKDINDMIVLIKSAFQSHQGPSI